MYETIINLQISKHFYNTTYNTNTDNLQEMILSSPMQYQEAVGRDMQLKDCLLSFTIKQQQGNKEFFIVFITLMIGFQQATI